MEKLFTEELLIKYLYHETTTAENNLVEDAIASNWEVHKLYEELESSYRELPKVTFSPKSSTIQKILGYSSEKPAIEPYV